MSDEIYNEEELRERRKQRIEEAKRQKQRQMMIRRLIRKTAPFIAGFIAVVLIIFAVKGIFFKPSEKVETKTENVESTEELNTASMDEMNKVIENYKKGNIEEGGMADKGTQEPDNKGQENVYTAKTSDITLELGGDIYSEHAIVIDLDSNTILAQKASGTRIVPASMTKVLTVLVAAEHVDNLSDTFTITREILDYSFANDCSNVGFEHDETVSIEDLFYGTILSSGADAAAGLAIYTAGSMEAFVDLMNEKLDELGLSETAHFTNCVGLYDENHYCTVYDMAIIMEAAMDNELCRKVMSAHTYTTSKTDAHPDGLLISNWFLRRIEDKDSGGEVVCGKTGYVVQSGNCAASYAEDKNGKGYICVTAKANSGGRCIRDHADLYKKFST